MDTKHKASIIDGKAAALAVRDRLRQEVSALRDGRGIDPALAVILVGENPASKVYVRNKGRACEEAGIRSMQFTLGADTPQAELLSLIDKLNNSPDVHGILVQLPVPAHIDEGTVLEAISPQKDVDGFHPCNMGRLVAGAPLLAPCTPYGIMRLIETIGYDLGGKDAVIVGRSNIVGKPMALMLLHKNATVTVCHSRTKDLADKVRAADVVVAAIGKERFIKGDWIKEGAVVMDVGINRTTSGGLAGDVDFEGAASRASWITPVPGGVGPMTIAMLLENTVKAARLSMKGNV
ncbi:MAG: bifunctional methylenetetrahydrofolate dehydrogenase/methenyltetrahydrofolate cyclohydrolase FolD [Deltaproteobacteria bacterium]|nr:bifunctional methylenetetrahydrofolate dehydrogenase/methenyltetrahydrofolate cyclohydrolase FolD [Deltaproteobacteria bacterium]